MTPEELEDLKCECEGIKNAMNAPPGVVAAIDPAVILAIIEKVLRLIEIFRNKP